MLGWPTRPIGVQNLWPTVDILISTGEVHANFGAQPFAFNISDFTKVRSDFLNARYTSPASSNIFIESIDLS